MEEGNRTDEPGSHPLSELNHPNEPHSSDEEDNQQKPEERERHVSERHERRHSGQHEHRNSTHYERRDSSGQHERRHSVEHERRHSGHHDRRRSGDHERRHSGGHERRHSVEHGRRHSGEYERRHSGEHGHRHSGGHERRYSGEYERRHSGEYERQYSGEHGRRHSEKHDRRHSNEHERRHSGEYERRHSGEHGRRHSEEYERRHSMDKKSYPYENVARRTRPEAITEEEADINDYEGKTASGEKHTLASASIKRNKRQESSQPVMPPPPPPTPMVRGGETIRPSSLKNKEDARRGDEGWLSTGLTDRPELDSQRYENLVMNRDQPEEFSNPNAEKNVRFVPSDVAPIVLDVHPRLYDRVRNAQDGTTHNEYSDIPHRDPTKYVIVPESTLFEQQRRGIRDVESQSAPGRVLIKRRPDLDESDSEEDLGSVEGHRNPTEYILAPESQFVGSAAKRDSGENEDSTRVMFVLKRPRADYFYENSERDDDENYALLSGETGQLDNATRNMEDKVQDHGNDTRRGGEDWLSKNQRERPEFQEVNVMYQQQMDESRGLRRNPTTYVMAPESQFVDSLRHSDKDGNYHRYPDTQEENLDLNRNWTPNTKGGATGNIVRQPSVIIIQAVENQINPDTAGTGRNLDDNDDTVLIQMGAAHRKNELVNNNGQAQYDSDGRRVLYGEELDDRNTALNRRGKILRSGGEDDDHGEVRVPTVRQNYGADGFGGGGSLRSSDRSNRRGGTERPEVRRIPIVLEINPVVLNQTHLGGPRGRVDEPMRRGYAVGRNTGREFDDDVDDRYIIAVPREERGRTNDHGGVHSRGPSRGSDDDPSKIVLLVNPAAAKRDVVGTGQVRNEVNNQQTDQNDRILIEVERKNHDLMGRIQNNEGVYSDEHRNHRFFVVPQRDESERGATPIENAERNASKGRDGPPSRGRDPNENSPSKVVIVLNPMNPDGVHHKNGAGFYYDNSARDGQRGAAFKTEHNRYLERMRRSYDTGNNEEHGKGPIMVRVHDRFYNRVTGQDPNHNEEHAKSPRRDPTEYVVVPGSQLYDKRHQYRDVNSNKDAVLPPIALCIDNFDPNLCPYCGVGVFVKKTSVTGYLTAILCFPCGLYCCLAKKCCYIVECTYCHATNDSWKDPKKLNCDYKIPVERKSKSSDDDGYRKKSKGIRGKFLAMFRRRKKGSDKFNYVRNNNINDDRDLKYLRNKGRHDYY